MLKILPIVLLLIVPHIVPYALKIYHQFTPKIVLISLLTGFSGVLPIKPLSSKHWGRTVTTAHLESQLLHMSFVWLHPWFQWNPTHILDNFHPIMLVQCFLHPIMLKIMIAYLRCTKISTQVCWVRRESGDNLEVYRVEVFLHVSTTWIWKNSYK